MTGPGPADLGAYVRAAADRGELVVQPRMGMSRPRDMAAGLRAVAGLPGRTVGTITVDSYTRVGDHERAYAAARLGQDVNGFPIVAHGPEVLAELRGHCPDRPIQVRHGSADPRAIFRTLAAGGLSASEGGPVSYCLPYGRTPLSEAVAHWRAATVELAARCAAAGRRAHLETFGGCMLGQMCPPSLLVALSVLEGRFFAAHGIRSISLSYAQQTSHEQDIEALAALRRLSAELIAADVDRHVVVYTYMGLFPSTVAGAGLLLDRSAELAVAGGAERLIVKTSVEAYRVPTIAENVTALRRAAAVAAATRAAGIVPVAGDGGEVYREARAICAAVLGLHDDIGAALRIAFRLGLLDIPFCIHRDNQGLTRAVIDERGWLRWSRLGRLPLPPGTVAGAAPMTAYRLLGQLRQTAERFDRLAATPVAATPVAVEPAPVGTAGTEPYRVVIVGTGPRGLSVLERLGARLLEAPPERPVEVVVVDAVQVGPGRIWRPNQPPWMLMNTPAGEVTMFSGPPDGGPGRPGNGPSLLQWWQEFDPAAAADAYAPRSIYGQYLRYVLIRVEQALAGVATVVRSYARVDDLAPAGGRYRLTLDDGQTLTADRVVLTVGHTLPALTPAQRPLAEFAARHPAARYIRGDSAADMPLAAIEPDATVGIIGLGLSFYDVVAGLTVGRGGRFTEDRGGLRYRPSGREPLIVAGSRTGVPLQARGRNQKAADHRYRPRLFTAARIAALRRGGPLDFRVQVLPWLLAEIDLVYLATEVRRRFGADVADRFRTEAGCAAEASDPRAELRRLAARYDIATLPEVDLDRWGTPFRGRTFSDPAAFDRALGAVLRRDLRLAAEGNVEGPVKACLDVIRDVRGVLRGAVEYGGLTPRSYREDFLSWFVPLASNLSTGPPRIRVQQMLALLDSGVLRVAGPQAVFSGDPATGRFVVESAAVAGSRVTADVLLDARIPAPDLAAESGLLGRLRDAGMLVSAQAGNAAASAGAAVTGPPYHPVRADGTAEPGLYLLGIPAEGRRWFTQVGSGRPGPWGEFTTDADAIAADALRGAGAAGQSLALTDRTAER
jgi:methylaspartate mutase epsilon subunit